MKQSNELSGIEVLRFFCAFGVLVWHYQHFFFLGAWEPSLSPALRPSEPLYYALGFFYENGSLSVPFFWVISGFIFYWHYSDSIRNRTINFLEFLVKRFSRLYPLHLVTLLAVAVGQWIYYSSHKTTFIYLWNKPIWFAAQLLFASNWLAREPVTFNGPIWSVSVEILIYVSFFFLARGLRPGVLSAAFATAVFAVCFNYLHSFINQEVFSCGMYFFAGCVTQRLAEHRSAFFAAGCAGGAMIVALILGIYKSNSASVLILATSSVVVFACLENTVVGGIFRRFAFLGNATYSSYLLHFPLQLLIVIVVDAIGIGREVFLEPVILISFLMLVIGLSLLIHRYFEMPAQQFIRTRVRPTLRKFSAPVAEE